MPNDRYRQLIRGVCTVAGIADVDTVLQRGSIKVKDTVFSLYPGDADNGGPADTLMAYCDFGEVPARNEAAVLRRLLEVNLFLSDAPLAAAFVINPDTRHVVFNFRLPLTGTPPEVLARKLEETSLQAERWRRDFFLDVTHAKSVSAADVLRGRR